MNEIASVADTAPHFIPDSMNEGCIDLQVNGYAGFDFNGAPLSESQLIELCQRLSSDNIAGILATIITAPLNDMLRRISAIANAIDNSPIVAERIWGIHIEGPFISPEPGYVGAHPAASVRTADWEICQRFLDAGDGKIRLWTLAPEMDTESQVTTKLAEHGVRVAAGHSNASIEELRRAIDAGLSLYTHLGNGCPALLPRHDNIIQRVLSLSEHLSISLIADRHHIPLFALSNYLKCIPPERIIVVSDCISAAGLGPGQYPLGDQTVYVDEDLAAWCEDRSHFAGSATTLPQMANIMSKQLDLPAATIDRFTRLNPAIYLTVSLNDQPLKQKTGSVQSIN